MPETLPRYIFDRDSVYSFLWKKKANTREGILADESFFLPQRKNFRAPSLSVLQKLARQVKVIYEIAVRGVPWRH